VNTYQWISIGIAVIIIAVLIIFRKTNWVKKTWKIIAIILPPLLTIALIALKNKTVPTPVPVPVPTPIPTPVPDPVIPTPILPTPVPDPVKSDSSSIVIGINYVLSPHFTYGQMTKTEHRDFIDKNRDQGKQYIDHLSLLCNNVLEPVWVLVGPISINSCFRCLDLNILIGGAKNSQHMVAEAADTEYAGITLHEAFNKIAFSNIIYSQIILEFNQWIHVGVCDSVLYPGKIRDKLIASTIDGKTVYTAIIKPI
jgi:hypothetical protein